MRPKFSNMMWLYRITLHYDQSWCQLRFEKAERYYTLCLEKDLLGDWTIVVSSGLRHKSSQKKLIAFNSYESAFEHLCNFMQSHLQQRYKFAFVVTNNLLLLNFIAFLGQFTFKNDNQVTTKPLNPGNAATLKKPSLKTKQRVTIPDKSYQQLSLF